MVGQPPDSVASCAGMPVVKTEHPEDQEIEKQIQAGSCYGLRSKEQYSCRTITPVRPTMLFMQALKQKQKLLRMAQVVLH